ncbi:hypothetical protein DL96DRAFT_1599960 [Flagelloscypha sp. PMI_526]|nr:hypothetical protein DL96DRAFT_1599960 [Flagelloscypha sp. PMI_526]
MRTYCEENTNQYQAVVTELRQFAADHNAAMSDLKQHVTSNITPLAVGISKISRRLEGQEVREFRDWLTPDYFIEDELRELLSKCAYQSGEWLLNSGEMRRWLQEGTSRFFVVIGPVAQHIMKQDLVCLPVFIKFGANMDLTLILRRLLTSLIPFVDSSLPASLHQLRRCNSFNHCQLLEILNDISSSFSSPVYIILDALDEFNVLTRRDLLDLLSSLLNIKVFVTSRALPLFDELSAIKLDLVTSNLYDLNAFIEAEVTDIGRVKEMVQLVTAASCQLFLLASLHVRSLHQCQRRSTALKTARNLPRTARDHYALTIKRIKKRAILDVESSDAALACLLWVWKAKYPLFPVELSEAVASLMDDLTGVSAEPYLIPPSKLLDLCEGLLHIQEGVVTFSRQYT